MSYSAGFKAELAMIDVFTWGKGFMQLKNGGALDFDRMPETLFMWSKKRIGKME